MELTEDQLLFYQDKPMYYMKKRLSLLSPAKQLLFGIVCCERMFPTYAKFSKEAPWKSAEAERKFIDLLWKRAENPTTTSITEKDVSQAEELVPDTDDYFPNPDLLNEACYASSSVTSLLFAICKKEDLAETSAIIAAHDNIDSLLYFTETRLEEAQRSDAIENKEMEAFIEELRSNPIHLYRSFLQNKNGVAQEENEYVRSFRSTPYPLVFREIELQLICLEELEKRDSAGYFRAKYGNCTNGNICYLDERANEIRFHPFWK
ncbi:MAG: DUF416 family protein [Thermoguttaceae bacterium]|nr:DUF416 family protein [Thermoguttaceae bacterium]